MGLGFKRAKVIGEYVVDSRRSGVIESADPLFDRDWDELVIRFDKKSRSFRVKTAVQSREQKNGRSTAKSTEKTVK
jgi:hypothetical protein